MIDFEEYIEKLRDLIEDNRKIVIISCAGLLFVFVILAFFAVRSDMNSRTAKRNRIEETKLVIDQPLMIPEGPIVPSGYITNRKTEKNWSDEEVENWFTLPDSEEVEKLGKANDRIINEIIGAAP